MLALRERGVFVKQEKKKDCYSDQKEAFISGKSKLYCGGQLDYDDSPHGCFYVYLLWFFHS